MKLPGWKPEEIAAAEARQREQARQERERLEAEEKRLLQEAEAEADRLASPVERKERSPAEVAQILEHLASQNAGPDGVRTGPGVDGRYLKRDRLRRVREQRALADQDARDQAYQKRIRPRVEKLEAELRDVDAELAAEEGRHAEAMVKLRAKRSDATEKIGTLVRTLGPDESTEDRLQAVMA